MKSEVVIREEYLQYVRRYIKKNDEEIAAFLEECVKKELMKNELSQEFFLKNRSVLKQPIQLCPKTGSATPSPSPSPSPSTWFPNPPIIELVDLNTRISTLSQLASLVTEQRHTNNPQDNQLIAIYQASRMGKTQLCVNLVYKKIAVVMLRFERLDKLPFTPILEEFNKTLKAQVLTNPTAFKLLSQLFIANQMIVQLWVLAHLEYLDKFFHHSKFVVELRTWSMNDVERIYL